MKNALLLVGVWVGIILFAYSVVYLTPDRPLSVTLAGDIQVTDEIHGFSLLLPVGWGFSPANTAGVLVPPVAGVQVWALSVPAGTTDEALAAAWEAIDPCSSCERSIVLASGGVSGCDGAVLELSPDGEGWTGRAVILLPDESARVLLIRRAPNVALPARVEDDLARMESGFRAFGSTELSPLPTAADDPVT